MSRITLATTNARIDSMEAALARIERALTSTPVPPAAAQVQAAATTLDRVRAAKPKTSKDIRRAMFAALERALDEGESYTSLLRADASLRAEYAALCDALNHPRTAEWVRKGMPKKGQ